MNTEAVERMVHGTGQELYFTLDRQPCACVGVRVRLYSRVLSLEVIKITLNVREEGTQHEVIYIHLHAQRIVAIAITCLVVISQF